MRRLDLIESEPYPILGSITHIYQSTPSNTGVFCTSSSCYAPLSRSHRAQLSDDATSARALPRASFDVFDGYPPAPILERRILCHERLALPFPTTVWTRPLLNYSSRSLFLEIPSITGGTEFEGHEYTIDAVFAESSRLTRRSIAPDATGKSFRGFADVSSLRT